MVDDCVVVACDDGLPREALDVHVAVEIDAGDVAAVIVEQVAEVGQEEVVDVVAVEKDAGFDAGNADGVAGNAEGVAGIVVVVEAAGVVVSCVAGIAVVEFETVDEVVSCVAVVNGAVAVNYKSGTDTDETVLEVTDERLVAVDADDADTAVVEVG